MSAIVTAVAAHAAAVLPFILLGTMAVGVRRDLGLDEAAFGAVPAVCFAVAAVLSPAAGRMAERRGATWGVTAAALSAAVSMVGIAVSTSWLTLLPFVAVAGASLAMAQPASDLWIARALPPTRHGLALGFKQASAGPGVGLLAGLAVPASAATIGWRGAFATAAAVGLIVPFTARRVTLAPSPPPRAKAQRREGDVSLAPLLVLTAAGGLASVAQAAFLTFAVSAAVDAGMSESSAGLLFAASAGLAFAARLLLGLRADRRSGGLVATTAALLATSAVGYLIFAADTTVAALIATPIIAATAWAWQGLFFLAVVRTNPNAPATASGITAAGLLAGAVVGPLAFGVLARDGYATAWVIAAAVSLASAALMVVGRWFVKRDLDRRLAVTTPSTRAAASPETPEDPPGSRP